MKSVGPAISPVPGSTTPVAIVCSGVSRRANASAVAVLHWSARARIGSSRSRSASTGWRPSAAGSPSNWMRSRVESSSSSHRAGRSSRVTPCRPSGGTTWLPGGSSPPSITSSRCGVAGPLVGAEPGPLAEVRRQQRRPGRPARSTPSASARPRRTAARSGRAAATSPSPSGRGSAPSESTATTRWSGEWNAVAEQISDRASERAGSSGPQTSIRSKARRSIDAGRSGWSRCTTSSRCSADAAAGSTWSIGVLSGGTSSSDERLRAHAVPDVQEVRVGRAVLPHPGPLVGQRRQRRPGRGGARSAPGAAGRRPRGRPCGRWRGSGGTRCASRSPAARAASAAGRAAR